MNEQTTQDNNKVNIEKAKTNLVIAGIASVVMLFAGLTSAYIVSMGDSFWLKTDLPSAFWISTAIILVSSITVQMALSSARKNQLGHVKIYTLLTLLLGISFVYFQFQGYKQLNEKGLAIVGKNILVTDGKYGDYFEVKYKGDFIEINGNDYLIKGEKMSKEVLKEYQEFMVQFITNDPSKEIEVSNNNPNFELYFISDPMHIEGNQLLTINNEPLQFLDRTRLSYLAIHVRDERGDFFARGEVGKDFKIYFKGTELYYKNRELYLDGQPIPGPIQIKAMESSDMASSYLFLITGLHLLHILVTLIYFSKLVYLSFKGKINAENSIKLKTGSIFWHFLGVLWVFLLLFFLFIH